MLLAIVLTAAACPRGFTPVDDDACAVTPKAPTGAVVYFHGMLSGATDWSHVRELELLGAEARKQSVTLVAMRGEKGLCLWAKDVMSYWCWPNDKSQLADISRLVERVSRVLARVPHDGAPVLAGFSNGGYFVTLLASDSALPASAYVVMHAGNVTGQEFPPARARPTLLVGASRDPIQLPTMRHLEAMLEPWQPQFVLHEQAHEVTAADAKSLFDFVGSLKK